MNKWNKLLGMMDEVYGFPDKKSSEFRKVAQHFDERTGEHVVVLEYRVRRGTQKDIKSQMRPGDLERQYELLKSISDMQKKLEKKGK